MRTSDLVVRGRYPWNSLDAVVFPEMEDSAQDIHQCLNCRYPECRNCLCQDATAQAIDRCEVLIQQQKKPTEICSLLHISRKTFYQYKTALAM